jgi:hypothetical protein
LGNPFFKRDNVVDLRVLYVIDTLFVALNAIRVVVQVIATSISPSLALVDLLPYVVFSVELVVLPILYLGMRWAKSFLRVDGSSAATKAAITFIGVGH